MWVLLAAAWADDTVVGGTLRAQVAYDPVRDFALEDFFTDSTFARAWAEGTFDRGDRWFIEGRFQHHLLLADNNVTPKFDPDVEGWWAVGLGETGWDGKIAGPVSLRVGALIERWGRLDLLPVADVLNARDFRAGLLAPVEFIKIPEPMAVLAVGGGAVRAETVIVPFASADMASVQGSNWSIVRQGWADDQLLEMQSWLRGDNIFLIQPAMQSLRTVVSDLDPSLRRNLDPLVLENELPQALWVNGEIAERVEFTGRNVDAAVMAGWLRSTQAQTSVHPTLEQLLRDEDINTDSDALFDLQTALIGDAAQIEWPRTFVAGADGSALVGPIQVRAETLWTEKKVVRLPYAQATTRPSIGAGLGLDYVRGSSFVATAEARWTHIFDAPGQMLLTLEDQVNLAGLIRWSILNQRVTIMTGGAVDPTYLEYAAAGPALSWRVSDHVLLELGGAVLIGSTPPPEEILDRDDDDLDALLYPGGPASYFQQNDAVFVALQLIR